MRRYFAVAALATLMAPAVAHAQAYAQLQLGLDSVSAGNGSQQGFSSGVSLGYEFPVVDKLFAGVEVSADDSTTKKCSHDILTAGDKLCEKTGRDLAASVHLGAKLSDSMKLYALAGYTNVLLTQDYTDAEGVVGVNKRFDGIRVGAGFKKDLSGQAFVKAEYRYGNYEQGFSRHNALVAVGINFF